MARPAALRPGDTVAVVAPAAAVEREHLKRGVDAVASLGFRVQVSEHALDRSGILAGTDRARAAELQKYFAEPLVKAIFAARGGYGCGRILPLLDFRAIARTPKIFLGFSDATFLLNAFVELSRMVCFHGPMVAMDLARGLSDRACDHLRRLLGGEMKEISFAGRRTVCPGVAEGEVVGGCLSVVTAALATPYAPTFEGRILFLEDTGEKAYRIDRMLVQLEQAGVLRQAAGVVFGGMRPVNGSDQEREMMVEFIAEKMADLGRPVIAGVEVGHGTEHLTMPFGLRARLDAQQQRLDFIEAAVD